MGYGYGVLNNWQVLEHFPEDYWTEGPYSKTRGVLDRPRYGWSGPAQRLLPVRGFRVEIEITLVYLDGRRKTVWLPVEELGRTLWVIKEEFLLNPFEPGEPHRQRFDWVGKTTFRQELVP